MSKLWKWWLAGMLLLLGSLVWVGWPRTGPLSDREWVQWIERCSEGGTEFVSDNWVSNEVAYPELLPLLKSRVRPGQVYVGVGPEQNFSYIAALRPSYAVIVDVRRGNMLEHLFFRVLFEQSEEPCDWLAGLLGRAPQPQWHQLPFPEWVEAVGRAPLDQAVSERWRQCWHQRMKELGFAEIPQDDAYLRRMQQQFEHQGLDLRFEYRREMPGQPTFPTFREVLLARHDGQYGCFLADREGYGFLRGMEKENRVIPVIGDFGGSRALTEVSCLLRQRHLQVGLFYLSNVEFYLMPQGQPGEMMENFVLNLDSLPTHPGSLLVRTHLFDLQGSPPYPHGNPVFVPRVQALQRFLDRYGRGELPDYRACMLEDDLGPGSPASQEKFRK